MGDRDVMKALARLADLMPPVIAGYKLQGQHLTVRLRHPMGIAERGHMLLQLEKRLRRELHPDMEVFLDTKADMNSLRRLRGVKI